MGNEIKFLASYPVITVSLNISLSWVSIMRLKRLESKEPLDAAEKKQ
jgi:hypothetical protein